MQSESIAKLVAALTKAQAKLTAPQRNREVTVTPRSGGSSYKFSYTTLDALIDHVREPLTSNGLWFVQTTKPSANTGEFILITTLVHDSGEWISSEIPMLDPGNNQQLGSSLTYQRRYALAAILGLAPDMDDDSNLAYGNTVEAVTDRAPPKPKPAPKTPDAAIELANTFARDAVAAITACQTLDELSAWKATKDPKHKTTNVDKVERLKDYNLTLYDTVMDALHDAYAKLF